MLLSILAILEKNFQILVYFQCERAFKNTSTYHQHFVFPKLKTFGSVKYKIQTNNITGRLTLTRSLLGLLQAEMASWKYFCVDRNTKKEAFN